MKAILISKKQLCHIYGLVMPSGIINYTALRKYYFTDEVLKAINVTEEEYKKLRVFPANITAKIFHELAITPGQLKMVGITYD